MLLCSAFVFCAQKIVSTLFWLPVSACFQYFASNFKIRPLSGHQIFQLTQNWLWCIWNIVVQLLAKFWSEVVWEVKKWVEGDPAKNFATKFSDWLDCVLGRRHGFCFGQCQMKKFRTSGETPVCTIEILVPESRLTPKILSRRYSDLDDWRTRNLCSF